MALEFKSGRIEVEMDSWSKNIRLTVHVEHSFYSFKLAPPVAIALAETLKCEARKIGIECALLAAPEEKAAEGDLPF